MGPRFRGDERMELPQLAPTTRLPYDAREVVDLREATLAGHPQALERYALAVLSHIGLVAAWYLFVKLGGAEIRHALAVRDGARAPRAGLPLAGKYRGDDRGNFRRLHPRRRVRHWRGAPVLLVPVVGNGGDAALSQPEHDS